MTLLRSDCFPPGRAGDSNYKDSHHWWGHHSFPGVRLGPYVCLSLIARTKYLTKARRKGGRGVKRERGLAVTVHRGGEVTIIRTEGSWSHGIYCQEAERDEGWCLAPFPIRSSIQAHRMVPCTVKTGLLHISYPKLETLSQTCCSWAPKWFQILSGYESVSSRSKNTSCRLHCCLWRVSAVAVLATHLKQQSCFQAKEPLASCGSTIFRGKPHLHLAVSISLAKN